MSEWKRVSLGDICSFKYGKMPKKTDKSDNGFPIFSGYGIVGFAKTYLYEKPEVIVVARGVGGTGDVKMSPPKCFLTNLAIAAQITCPEVDKQFLYYRLQHPSLWELRTGSAQAQITIAHLEPFETEIPSLPTQRKIASILSAYDDLIENNTRRIAILEEMAQAIYREWFVNFRFPGHENVKLVQSTMGMIPESWNRFTLDAVCDLIVDSEHKTAPTQKKGFPSIRTPNIGRGHLLLENVLRVSEETYTQWTRRATPEEGDLILAREAPVGNVAIVPSNERVCLGQRTVLVRADRSKVDPHYLLRILLSDDCQNRFSGASSGATVAHLNLRDLRGLEIACASKDLQAAAVTMFESIDRQVANLFKRNRNLRTTRDLLLPKLISGQLDVEDLDIDLGLTADELQETIA